MVSWQDDVMIPDGFRQEIRGLAGVSETYHLLRPAQVRF